MKNIITWYSPIAPTKYLYFWAGRKKMYRNVCSSTQGAEQKEAEEAEPCAVLLTSKNTTYQKSQLRDCLKWVHFLL